MKSFIPIFVEATVSAAKAAVEVAGRRDAMLADQKAVDAMRAVLSQAPFSGTVVIGEGERDEAPMLYIGEKVGDSNGTKVDIALDPLEGTNICANYGEGAMSVIAYGPENTFLHAADVYMQKIAVGRGLPQKVVSLKYRLEDNLSNVAKAKGIPVSELKVVVLKRPRHDELIRIIKGQGARIKLINDGDINAILSIILHDEVDIYIGTGGAPEGVLAASVIRSLGGQMEGKLLFNSEEDQDRAKKMGITDMNKVYSCDELVKNDQSIFIATGVTTGPLLSGVQKIKDKIITHSLLISKNQVQRISSSKFVC